MGNPRNSILLKVIAVTIIALLLLIPAVMIEDLVDERAERQEEAIIEVGSKWGKSQTITGPIITIPYFRYVKEYPGKDTTGKTLRVADYIHILPAKLDVKAEILPEKRYRGLYEIVVYNSDINFSGTFEEIKSKIPDIPTKDIRFDKASVTMGISDLRGIEEQAVLTFGNNTTQFNPGTVSSDLFTSGINTDIPVDINNDTPFNFHFQLKLKGSQKLYFVPVGKVTDIHVKSAWNTPSFNGAFLPDSRKITAEGFEADWKVLNLNRNYPQSWKGAAHKIDYSAFGVDLILPVDNYQKTTRSIKYAILFIALTFIVFFFVEILSKRFIHPVQYILVGLALVLFFTLLLSFSEHMHYNLAYGLASLLTLGLVTGYVRAILKSNSMALMLGGILLILYTFIFIVIQLEDYALLMGSIGLFIVLGFVMYFSRKIDWYNITRNTPGSKTETVE